MPLKKNSLKECKLYLILDTDVCDYRRLLTVLKSAVVSGVDIVQLRDKNGTARDILEFSAAALRITRHKVPYIMNDRIDLALASGADSVHVGQTDIPVPAARTLAGKKLIVGASCQDLAQAVQAEKEGADYIGFGSVFKTLTKPERDLMDLKVLKTVLYKMGIPVFPIGGITSVNLGRLISLGAERIAVCRDICLAKDVAKAVKGIRRQLEK